MEAVVRSGIGKGLVLVHNGYRYQRNKVGVNSISWRCWKRNCRGRAKTDAFEVVEGAQPTTMEVTINHDHEEDDEVIDRERAFQAMREEIRHDPSRPVRRVYNEVAGHYDDVDVDVPIYDSLRSRLHRARREGMPPIPRRVEDVRVEGEWARTWSGHPFLTLTDNAAGVLVFMSEACIQIFSEINTVFVDGTFKTTPRPYTQLVTLHGRYHGNVLTLAYALMTGKRLHQYRRLLQHVKDQVVAHGGVFVPTQVIADFESAIRSAFLLEFPGIRVRGCYFHLTQSLWRKIQELGLAGPYSQNPRLKRLIRKVFAIGYLPVPMVRNNLMLLRNSRQTARAIARYPALGDFFRYVHDTYIVGPFPVPSWNVFDRAMEFRTTNVVEGFHNKWNRDVGVNHPSLWHFIRCLKDDQREESVRIRQALRGDLVAVRRRKWRLLEQRIARQKAMYTTGEIRLLAYWRAITYAIKTYH